MQITDKKWQMQYDSFCLQLYDCVDFIMKCTFASR